MPERGEPQNKAARTLGQGDDLRCIQILISQKTCEPVVALLTHCCVDTKQKIVCNCKDASGPCVTLALQILVPGFPITRGPGVNGAAKSNCLQRGREETSLETGLWKRGRHWDITKLPLLHARGLLLAQEPREHLIFCTAPGLAAAARLNSRAELHKLMPQSKAQHR